MGLYTLVLIVLRPHLRRFFLRSSKHLASVRIESLEEGLELNFYVSAANAIAQLLTVPPYAVAAFCLVSLSYVADYKQSRGMFMAGASFIGGIGYM